MATDTEPLREARSSRPADGVEGETTMRKLRIVALMTALLASPRGCPSANASPKAGARRVVARPPAAASGRRPAALADLARLRKTLGTKVVVTLVSGARIRGSLVRVEPTTVVVAGHGGSFFTISVREVASVRSEAESATRKTALSERERTARRLRALDREVAASGRLCFVLGAGFTLTGLGVGIAGTIVSIWSISGGVDSDDPSFRTALFSGIAMGALGAAMLVGGATTWLVGSLRRSVAGAGSSRELTRRRWLMTGVLLTSVGAMLGIGGGVWMGVDPSVGMLGGSVLLSVGLFLAVGIGLPMWIDAWRLGLRYSRIDAAAEDRHTTHASRQRALDPNHEQRTDSRVWTGLPRATVFSTQIAF